MVHCIENYELDLHFMRWNNQQPEELPKKSLNSVDDRSQISEKVQLSLIATVPQINGSMTVHSNPCNFHCNSQTNQQPASQNILLE